MDLYYPSYLYSKKQFLKDYALAVEKGVIQKVSPFAELRAQFPNSYVHRWENQVLLPGTVNAHNHSFQSLLRGIAADRPFLEWRDCSLYRYSPRMRLEDIYNGAVFAFSEMLQCGVTTVSDFFTFIITARKATRRSSAPHGMSGFVWYWPEPCTTGTARRRVTAKRYLRRWSERKHWHGCTGMIPW